jgi:hypothetical protein
MTGRCHCGNVEVEFETALAPAALSLRACQCTFCRQHGVRATSDPLGRLRFRVREPAALSRYAFGLKLADMLVCSRCGVYVGAVMTAQGRTVGTLNANCLDLPGALTQEAVPMNFDAETPEQRTARRLAGWTPAELVLEGSEAERRPS